MTTPARAPVGRRTSYFGATRSPRYSLLFALPLFVAYEALATTLTRPAAERQVRNGADVLLHELAYLVAGPYGSIALMTAIIGLSVIFVVRDVRRSGGVRPVFFLGMLGEATALALAFGLVIGTITAQLLGGLHLLTVPGVLSLVANPLVAAGAPHGASGAPLAQMSWQTRLMLSLGAGVFEELLFRVLLVSALAMLGRVLFGFGRTAAGVFAAIVGALVFSAFHYIGPFGERFDIQSFAFRAVSGLAFSGLYLLRGFGITAWTHALYDAFLLL